MANVLELNLRYGQSLPGEVIKTVICLIIGTIHQLASFPAGIDQILVTACWCVLFITKVIDILVYQLRVDSVSAPADKCDIDQHSRALCADSVY